MDLLISTAEDLQRELKKIPKSDATSVQRELERLRDQWLEVDAGFAFLLKKKKKTYCRLLPLFYISFPSKLRYQDVKC